MQAIKAIVESDHSNDTRAPPGFDYPLSAFNIGGERLLEINMLSLLDGGDRSRGMKAIWQANHHGLHVAQFQHFLVPCKRSGSRHAAVCLLQPLRIGIC